MKVTWGHRSLSLLIILFTNSISIFGQNVGANTYLQQSLQNIDCASTNSESSSTGNQLMNTLLTLASANGVLSNILPVLQHAQQNQPSFSLKPIIISQTSPTVNSEGSSQLNLSKIDAVLSLPPQVSCAESSQPNFFCPNAFTSDQNADLPKSMTEFVSKSLSNCGCEPLWSSLIPCQITPSLYGPKTCLCRPSTISSQSTLRTTPYPCQTAQYEWQAVAPVSTVPPVVIESGNGERNLRSNLKTILPILFLALFRNSFGGCGRCGGCRSCGGGFGRCGRCGGCRGCRGCDCCFGGCGRCGDCGGCGRCGDCRGCEGRYGYGDYGLRDYSGHVGCHCGCCSKCRCSGCSTRCYCCQPIPIPIPYPYLLEIPLPSAEEDSPEGADDEDEENPSENKPQDCTQDKEDEQESQEKPEDENKEIET